MEKERKIKQAVKCVVFLLLLCMALAKGGMEAEAAGMSLSDLQAKFPGGKYWNHATQSGHDYNEETLEHSGNCNNPDGYTDTPCTNHYLDIRGAGYYDCNSYGGAIQCCGFAYKLADDAYGSMPNSWGTTSAGNAKAGDVVHFHTGDQWGHWAMIIGRNGTTVALGECNYDLHCRIDWGRTCDLSAQSCTIYSAPWELQQSSSSGGNGGTGGNGSTGEVESVYSVSIYGDTVTIDKYLGDGGDITIPSEIDGKEVTGIGAEAFSGCEGLTGVVIPLGVTDIGERAFAQCENLKSVSIPYGIDSIRPYVFYECESLRDVSITRDVKSIGAYAFSGTPWLSDQYHDGLAIVNHIVVSANDNYFYDRWLSNENNEGVSTDIPFGVEGIADYAFYGCTYLGDVNIPSSVKTIGEHAFEKAGFGKMGSISIAEGIESIGAYAFASCYVRSINIPSTVKEICEGTYKSCSWLTGISIAEGVENIGAYAFAGCHGLTDVHIPSSMTDIGSHAFTECNSLGNVNIPSSVKMIGEYAFSDCDGLTGVSMEEGVEDIGVGAFSSCFALKSVNIPSMVKKIGEGAFNSCESLKSINIAEGVEGIGADAFAGCALKSVNIPSTVKKIGESAFEDCESLKSVNIAEGVESIGDRAFRGNLSLESVNIPSTVKDIGDYAFECVFYEDRECILSVNIVEGVKHIGDGAFHGCRLMNVNIPPSVTYIGADAFHENNLTSVNIPSGVQNIGAGAFSSNDLKSVNIAEGVQSIGESAFSFNRDLNNVHLPSSVTYIGDWAFSGHGGLASINIPSGVTYIGADAFFGSELTSVNIPSGVTVINENTFSWNQKLASANIPLSVTSIKAGAFEHCIRLKDIYYEGSQEQWNRITVDEEGNACLKSASIHFHSTGPKDPDEAGSKAVNVKKIAIVGISHKIAQGKKITLKAAVSPANATNKSVTWKSGNVKYATVNSKGIVTLKKAGAGKTVTVTATAKDGSGKKGSYKIRIMKGVVGKVTIAGKANRSAKAGTSIKLKASVKASGKANKALQWKSSHTRYAVVDGKGRVTFKKAGKGKNVKITVMATDGSGKKASVRIKIMR